MDLELHGPEPTEDERAAIDAAIGPPVDDARSVVGVAEAARRRPLLLPALHAAQARVGWVSPGALAYVSRRLHVPPAEAYGVASFYALYALHPRARSIAHVCDDIGCKARGADALCDELGARLGPAGSQHGGAGWMRSPCLGLCEQAPVALIQHAGAPAREGALGEATADRIVQALGETDRTPEAAPAVVHQDRANLTLLARVGLVDPTSLDDYRARGGYRALRRALDRGGASVLHELTVAKLAGRGGAAFPTARKWQAVAAQPARPHYVVCNADESEPGTFKDRVLMEQDPFAVIEGVTLAAFATASEKAYLYVRAEYPLAAARLQNAIDLARSRGFLGDDVLGRGVKVDIEIRRGAGAYICGEETALLSSIEGHRGEPRNKPPFPVEIGLFGKPTAINNVETLCAAVAIVADGGAAWAAVGTPDSTGTRLFCVSGHVGRPGVYELPMGERLSTLLDLARAERVSAVLLGGAAGAFLGPDELDVPLSFEGTRAIGATLGSGVVMVLREGTELLPYLRRMAAFFRDESCGQCVPCRVGTVRVEELLARAALRGPTADDRALLSDLSQVMRDASICGLGQTATSALDSAVKRRLALVDGGCVVMGKVSLPVVGTVEITIDGRAVRVREGATLREACAAAGIEIPTLCWAETLTPVNVCRVCVVELAGARTLVPSCSRKVEAGMAVQTDSERVRVSRRMVLELLASSVDTSTAPSLRAFVERYGADPDRFGPRAIPAAAGERDAAHAGHHAEPDGATAATVGQPVKVDNDLYVRDYAKCILCYKCVEACGMDAQGTFAIAVAGRGFDARISTEHAAPLPDSACVYCGNCIAVCPTGALMAKTEHDMRAEGTWREPEQKQTDTVCPYCGVGCVLRLHTQDDQILKVTSPVESSVTSGNLCIKGRFGFGHVAGKGR